MLVTKSCVLSLHSVIMSKINNASTKRLCSWVGNIRARRSNCLSLLNEWKGIISWFLPNLSFSHIISVLKIVPHGLCVSRMCIWKSSCYNGPNTYVAACIRLSVILFLFLMQCFISNGFLYCISRLLYYWFCWVENVSFSYYKRKMSTILFHRCSIQQMA